MKQLFINYVKFLQVLISFINFLEMPRRSRSKRLRFQDDPKKIQICPLEFGVLPELHELIFQHLDSADVLILSETNKNWWNKIGESKKCMNQVRLGLENWEATELPEDMVRIMNIVRKSTRRYQAICINSSDDRWVSKKAVQLLRYFSPSLVDVRFLNADGILIKNKFTFPRLERLQFINNVPDIDELFLSGSTCLIELNLKHHYWANPEPVMKCLKVNKNLTCLKLWDTGIAKLFQSYEPNCFPFKLKKFATGADGTITEEAEENFIHFLDSQSKSIEAIRFRSGLDGANASIINKVFEMTAMKIIHFDAVGNLGDLCLSVNPRIIEFRLPWSIDTLDKMTPFLRALPKVKVLYLRKVNMDILKYIALHMKELKILYYSRAEGCMGCFTKFIASTEKANKDIMLVSKEWY